MIVVLAVIVVAALLPQLVVVVVLQQLWLPVGRAKQVRPTTAPPAQNSDCRV